MFKTIDASTILSGQTFQINEGVDCFIKGTIPDGARIECTGNLRFERMGRHCHVTTTGALSGDDIGDFPILNVGGALHFRHLGKMANVTAGEKIRGLSIGIGSTLRGAEIHLQTAERECTLRSTQGDVRVTRAGKNLTIYTAGRGYCVYPEAGYTKETVLPLALPPAQFTHQERLERAGVYQCAGKRQQQYYYIPKALMDDPRYPDLLPMFVNLANHTNAKGRRMQPLSRLIMDAQGQLQDTQCVNRRSNGFVDQEVERYLAQFEADEKAGGRAR